MPDKQNIPEGKSSASSIYLMAKHSRGKTFAIFNPVCRESFPVYVLRATDAYSIF